MAKRRTTKKTYSEFMSWLEGVESMQEADWCPNAPQWKTIREMLNHMKPEVIEKELSVSSSRPQPPQQQYEQHIPVPVPVPTNAYQPMPVQEGHLPPQRLMPSGLQESPSVAPGVPAATSTRKDQVLDTSDGNYTSEFA